MKHIVSKCVTQSCRDNLNENFVELKNDAKPFSTVQVDQTPGTGDVDVSFFFFDDNGNQLLEDHAGFFYFSNAFGVPEDTPTITAVATIDSGVVVAMSDLKFYWYRTGGSFFNITIDGDGELLYITFIRPDGRMLTTGVITVGDAA